MVEAWKKIKEEIIELNYRKIVRRTYRWPDSSDHEYEILLNRPVSVVLALTVENKVVMAQQFRPGLEEVLLEMPAGIVDPGETPEQAASRELLEETGYSGELEYVGPCYRDAYSTIVLHSFVAKNAKKIKEPHGEDDAFIESVELALDEFRAHLRSGKLTDVGPAYLALDYLNLL